MKLKLLKHNIQLDLPTKLLAIDISIGKSLESSLLHSGEGTPQLKHTGMSSNQGMVQGSLTEKAQSSFVRWAFSSPLILAPLNHSFSCSLSRFPTLCCRLYFFFLHPGFQMVERSCVQQLATKIGNNLVHFPCEFQAQRVPPLFLNKS